MCVRRFAVVFAVVGLAAVGAASCMTSDPPAVGPGWIDDARLASGEAAGAQWLTQGGDAGKTRHSSLTQINTDTVDRLGFAWEHDVGWSRVMEATPVVVDGVMYMSGPGGMVMALDGATGAERWVFRPELDSRAYRTSCCDLANRGVAVWEGLVYVAAVDGVLYALNATDGSVVWSVDTIVDRDRAYSSTGAPEVAGDVVVIGNGGAEYGVRGYVTAYDLRTGEERWRFWTVPRDPALGPQESPALEAALETWDPESRWELGLGGTVWDAIVYDRDYDTLLIGVGNGGPFPNRVRSPEGGDNLYLSSIVALDPATGEMKWHYQETPGESWDFTATQPMMLTEMEVDGETRPVVLHAPKNGFFYVLDRRDGTLLRAHPFARRTWASHVDLETGRPALTPESSDYTDGPQIVFPSVAGARNWQPMAFNPDTGLVYMNVLEMGNLMAVAPPVSAIDPDRISTATTTVFSGDIAAVLPGMPEDVQATVRALPAFEDQEALEGRSFLRAIDPLTGERVWEVEMSGWWDRSGVLSTDGGLVFAGDDVGRFRAYDAATGALLSSIDVGTSIMAAPATYAIDGTQYVAVGAAWGGGGWSFPHPGSASYLRGNDARILAFRLDGGVTPMPDLLPPLEVIEEPPAQAPGVTEQTIAEGGALFATYCAICHANQYRSAAPDLRRMGPGAHAAFSQIVLQGVLEANAMPRWDDVLDEDDVGAIHAYLINLQSQTRAGELAAIAEGRDPFNTTGVLELTRE